MPRITNKLIISKLKEVLDPEIAISIVDMGFIYDIKIIENKKVSILMTLSTSECPLCPIIEEDVKAKLKEIGVKEKDTTLKLTFDPPWSIDKMSKKGKKALGF